MAHRTATTSSLCALISALLLLPTACSSGGGSECDWYRDQDLDGFGDLESKIVADCGPQVGFVNNWLDCDDGNRDINPGQPDVCDGVDNDCDGETDAGVGAGAPEWYPDMDADGFGDGFATPVRACTAPEGHVEDHSDCDDTRQQVRPGANELCDMLDNNCDGQTDEPEAAPEWWPDLDGDGFGDSRRNAIRACEAPEGRAPQGGDCDDNDMAIHPDAVELCDGVDNNCDGMTDLGDAEDAREWWPDTDRDTYGDRDETPRRACRTLIGMVERGGDCDDEDGSRNPGIDEVCDGVDNDCDDAVDEDDAAPLWYPDPDRDGYADANASAMQTCAPPPGFVTATGDCLPDDPSVNPEASERCDNIDNDCDGETDEDSAIDAPTWYPDLDGDEFGDMHSPTPSCSQPEGFLADGRDCNDETELAGPGQLERCDGLDNDCDGDTDEFDAIDPLTWYPDNDGDGFGVEGSVLQACNQPEGFADNTDDCYDDNRSVYPGQDRFFANERGDGSFDYDCDGEETLEFPNHGRCDETCSVISGWYALTPADPLPGCGDFFDFLIGCAGGARCNRETYNKFFVECR